MLVLVLVLVLVLPAGADGAAGSYASWSYYAKWGASMASIMLERGLISPNDLDANLGARSGGQTLEVGR